MAHWIFLFLIVFSLVGLPSDDWGEIEELSVVSSNATTKTIRNYWDEHFYGSISGIVSGGQNHSRMASQIEVGFSDHWQNIKFVIEGSYQKNTLKTKYDLVTESPPSAKTSVELDEIIRYESLQFEQAYIEFYPIKPLTLSYGQQTIVWGQLDIFSPVDFLLPTDFNPVGFSFSKADNRLAQMTLKLSYYLTRELEFTSYYFPYFVENNLFQTLDLSDNYQIIDGVKYNTQKIVPKGNDQDSYAFRAAYYRPEYTVAFTYYRGFNHLVPIFREKYLSSSSNDLDYVNEYGFYSKQAFGAEMSIPMGNKTLKFEATLSDAFYQGLETSSAVVNAFHQYTGGYGDVPVYEGIFAVGIDAAYDEWFYNVYLMNLTYFKNPNYNDFWSVYESQFGAIQFESIPLFPTINLGRYLGSEKKGAIGVALGYFTGSLGTYVYVTNQISESLSWGLTGDVGFNFTDHLFSGSSNNDNTNDEGYSYKEYQLVEPKITFGLGYKL